MRLRRSPDQPGPWAFFADFPRILPYLRPHKGLALASLGIFVAWRAFQARRELVHDGFARTALEHKLWFDELYDVAVSRPAQVVAMRLRDRVEAPVVQGGLDEVAEGAVRGAAATASVQSGLLRTYALAFTVAVAVLTLVFLVVR